MSQLMQDLDRYRARRDHLAVVIARLAADSAALRPATLEEFREADAGYVRTLHALTVEHEDDCS